MKTDCGVEKAVNVACKELQRRMADQETKLIGGRVKRDRSGLLNREESGQASGFDHLKLAKAQLTAAAQNYRESQSPSRSALLAELSKYRNAIERTVSASQQLEATRASGQNGRVAQQRLTRSKASLERRLASLSADAESALGRAQQIVSTLLPSSGALLVRLRAAELAFETVADRPAAGERRREVARAAAAAVSYLDPIGWRRIVGLFMKELGCKCPDPVANPARFDQVLGVAWIAKHVINLPSPRLRAVRPRPAD